MVWEHRIVWETWNGPIPRGMVVHHKNMYPQDNRIENLELLSRSEHSRYHQTQHNSFKGKQHTEEFKKNRSIKYSGNGNPRFLSHVNTDDILQLRNSGLNWCEISRIIGINRKTAKNRYFKERG